MRLLCAFVLAAFSWVLPLALGGDGAVALVQCNRPSSASEPQLVLEAGMICGMFDGRFTCKTGASVPAQGKNAIPGARSEIPEEAPEGRGGTWQGMTTPPAGTDGAGNGGQGTQTVAPGEHSCPPGYRVLAVPGKDGYCEPPEGTAEAISAGCQHGMVGTPPNCHCPRNSELLGGNCVHYSATCTTALAADAIPQPCQGAEEKLACKMRQDGLKDCCCLTYDKL
jgi:hypothetical protein